MENKYNAKKHLINGTAVYFVGTFVSKILQFLILPFLTNSLSPAEYGYYDSLVALSTLVVPLLTLQTIEGMFRFTVSSNYEERKKVITNVHYVLITTSIIMFLIVIFVKGYLDTDIEYFSLIYIYMISTMYFTFFQKIVRSKGLNKLFAVSGIMYTFLLLSLQFLFIKFTDLGVNGLLISNIISSLVISLWYIIFLDLKKYFKFKKPDFILLKEIFRYSLPLVPNNLSWWGITTLNTFIVISVLGVDSNGLLAIAGKFPGMLTLATSVFQLAWQETAIKDSEENSKSDLYNQTFGVYFRILSTSTVVTLIASKLIFPFLVGDEFIDSIKYLPFLFYSALFASISAFLGVSYTTTKKTIGAFSTTFFGFVTNLLIVLCLINIIGLYAAVIGKMVSFLVVVFLRFKDSKKLVKIKFIKKDVIKIVLLNIFGILVFYNTSDISLKINLIVIVCFYLIININEVKKISQMVSKIYKRRI